jgi:hypothetical protein
MTYNLIMLNAQGASEESEHASKDAVRLKIRTWDARNMTARIYDSNGNLIYEGPALGFCQ